MWPVADDRFVPRPPARPLQQREAKFAKAAGLLEKLLGEALDERSWPAFADAIDAAAANALPHTKSPGPRAAVASLFAAVDARLESFRKWGVSAHRERMWALRGSVPAALWGDDTFAFAGACQRVERLVLDALPRAAQVKAAEGAESGGGEADSTAGAASGDAELQGELVACLSHALRRYAMPWARQPVNSLFATATHERMRLTSTAARKRLDDMATELARRRAAPTQRAKALWTKRDEQGSTHPLRRRGPGGALLR